MSLPEAVLRVDLTERAVTAEDIPEPWRRSFIGGKGLGVRYLFEMLNPDIDPLGSANVLCLFRGPFSGYLPGETRFAAITKSPLTGIFVDSYSGGSFADAFVDALGAHVGIIIEGVADEPVTVHLEGGEVEIDETPALWGSDVRELDASLDGAVAGIGPAGESLVRFATIATDGGDHHAGRGGTGAVMGSKRLKAIVARGEPSANPELEAIRARYEERFHDHPEGRAHRASGTLETVDAADELGVLPTMGWRAGRFDGADAIGIDAIQSRADGREASGSEVEGDFQVGDVVPRGGLGIALGANLGIGDLDEVMHLARLCDTLGMDFIETGNAVAWAMLASEEGVIDRTVRFDAVEDASQLIEEIATRSSRLGELLAAGIDRAASRLGGANLVPTVKSMSAASYDPRRAPSMALAFATSDRGACHRRSHPVFAEVTGTNWDDNDRITAVINEQNRSSLLWSYIVDDVTAPAFEADLGIEYFDAIGVDITSGELERIGERVWTLTRLFNIREGVTRDDDNLPKVFTQPIDTGGDHATIDRLAFARLLSHYYERRGWTQEGVPTASLCESLGLVEELAEVGDGVDRFE